MSVAARVSLIVLAWNRWELTARALDSLLACELGDADILVVDNGSSDETPQRLPAYAPRVRSLGLAQNVGFVRGINAGIAAVDADSDVVLLNNDLVFEQRDWLQRLRRCVADNPRCGIAGCRLVDGAGGLLHAGTRLLPDDVDGVQVPSGRIERRPSVIVQREAGVERIGPPVRPVTGEITPRHMTGMMPGPRAGGGPPTLLIIAAAASIGAAITVTLYKQYYRKPAPAPVVVRPTSSSCISTSTPSRVRATSTSRNSGVSASVF